MTASWHKGPAVHSRTRAPLPRTPNAMAAVSRALAGIKHPPRSSPRRMSRGRRSAVAVAAAKAPATSIASNANDEASSAQEGGYFGSGFDAPNEYGYFESAITVAEQKRKDKLTEGGFKQIKGLSAEEALAVGEGVKLGGEVIEDTTAEAPKRKKPPLAFRGKGKKPEP